MRSYIDSIGCIADPKDVIFDNWESLARRYSILIIQTDADQDQ